MQMLLARITQFQLIVCLYAVSSSTLLPRCRSSSSSRRGESICMQWTTAGDWCHPRLRGLRTEQLVVSNSNSTSAAGRTDACTIDAAYGTSLAAMRRVWCSWRHAHLPWRHSYSVTFPNKHAEAVCRHWQYATLGFCRATTQWCSRHTYDSTSIRSDTIFRQRKLKRHHRVTWRCLRCLTSCLLWKRHRFHKNGRENCPQAAATTTLNAGCAVGLQLSTRSYRTPVEWRTHFYSQSDRIYDQRIIERQDCFPL